MNQNVYQILCMCQHNLGRRWKILRFQRISAKHFNSQKLITLYFKSHRTILIKLILDNSSFSKSKRSSTCLGLLRFWKWCIIPTQFIYIRVIKGWGILDGDSRTIPDTPVQAGLMTVEKVQLKTQNFQFIKK